MNEEKIAAKVAEIEHYKGVLERYKSGRWYDQGRRHLDDLEQQLAEERLRVRLWSGENQNRTMPECVADTVE